MPERDFRPVFVVGVPRSGTTLVRMVLGAHPAVYASAEAPWFGGNYGRPDASIRGLLERLVHDDYGPVKTMPSISEDEVHEALRAFVQTLVSQELSRAGKKVWVEKTPDNIIHLPFITTLFPDARIVHVLRDGRDVAVSSTQTNWPALNYFVSATGPHSKTLRMHRRAQLPTTRLNMRFSSDWSSSPWSSHRSLVYTPLRKTYLNALWRWREWLHIFDRDAHNSPCPILNVRFEELLANPEQRFKDIFNYLDLTWRPDFLQYARFEQARGPVGDMGAYSALAHKRIDPGNTHKWPRELNFWQRLITRWYFDDFLVAKGYGPTR